MLNWNKSLDYWLTFVLTKWSSILFIVEFAINCKFTKLRDWWAGRRLIEWLIYWQIFSTLMVKIIITLLLFANRFDHVLFCSTKSRRTVLNCTRRPPDAIFCKIKWRRRHLQLVSDCQLRSTILSYSSSTFQRIFCRKFNDQ